MRKALAGWTGLILLTVLGVATPLLFSTLPRSPLPRQLAGLKVERLSSGEEALSVIDRMHGKGVATRENFIGSYSGANGRATLYLTVYPDERQAKLSEIRMALRIETSVSEFTHFRRMRIGAREVSTCVGLGQVHFFFAQSQSLYWLASDVGEARSTIEDLVARVAR